MIFALRISQFRFLWLALILVGLTAGCSEKKQGDRDKRSDDPKISFGESGADTTPVEAPEPSSTEAAPEDLDALSIFNLMQESWNGIESYRCNLENYAKQGEKEEQSLSEYYFKRPHQIRMDFIEGDDEGSSVARDAEGINRGKAGGLLGAIKLKMADDNKELQSVRGIPFFKSDWGTIMGELQAWVDEGWTLERLDDEPMADVDCYVIEMTAPEGTEPPFRQRMWIDRDRHLLIRRSQYENEVLVDHDVYHNIELNVEIDDEIFGL